MLSLVGKVPVFKIFASLEYEGIFIQLIIFISNLAVEWYVF